MPYAILRFCCCTHHAHNAVSVRICFLQWDVMFSERSATNLLSMFTLKASPAGSNMATSPTIQHIIKTGGSNGS